MAFPVIETPPLAGAASIAGFPASELEFREGGLALRLFVVGRLEDLVDRDRLLSAEEVPEPPYWAHLWTGARALARELAHRGDLAAKRVLDLGCGLGLPGLVAAAKGAEAWFADREAAALAFVRASAHRNGLHRVHTVQLDFTRDSLPNRFDCVLGAEIVYDPSAYEPLARFVDRHLAPGGTFLATDAFRSDASRFFDALQARGFRGERRAVREWDEGRWQGVFLWRFER